MITNKSKLNSLAVCILRCQILQINSYCLNMLCISSNRIVSSCALYIDLVSPTSNPDTSKVTFISLENYHGILPYENIEFQRIKSTSKRRIN